MRVVHIVECFAAGTAHFINLLTQHIACEHVVIHGERSDEISAEAVKAKFPQKVKFVFWKNVQREIMPIADFKALIELIKILNSLKNVDVIHMHSSKAGFLGRVACFITGKKNVIYTPNGASFAKSDVSNYKKRLYIFLERLADKLSGRVVCCSKSESESFEKIGIQSTFINNGTVIPVSYHEKQIQSEAGSTFSIVTCGRITEQKNPVLFNQIASFFQNQPNINFIWIGDGEPEQRTFLKSKNIKITGWLPKEDVESAISSADLYLSTSLWEGLPFSVLEALSLGKCLVLSNCVGNVDLVKDGYNGFIFNSADEAIDKIKWLLNRRDVIAQMQRNSREWSIKEFDIRSVSNQYQQLYNSFSDRVPDTKESLSAW